MGKKHRFTRWLIWSLTVSFAFYEYLLRVSTSVMVPELMQSFNVDATTLGTIAAFYLYAYGPMQLPVGMLIDRYGARKLLTFAGAICGIGGVVFGYAMHVAFAEIGRLFIGLGSSFAFVGMVYVCQHWFRGGQISLLIGLGNSIGVAGAVVGEGPLTYAVANYGWRATSIAFGIIGFIIAFIIYIAVRNEPVALQKSAPTVKSAKRVITNLKSICFNIQTWINGFVSIGLNAAPLVFGALWGPSFLQTAYGMSKAEAGFASSMIYVGWIVGGPLVGYFSDHIKKRKPMLIIAALLDIILLTPVIYYTNLNVVTVFILLFLVGFVTGAQLLTYSFAIELNPQVKSKGTPIAITNFLAMSAGSILQPLIGYFLDISAGARNAQDNYTTLDYQYALAIIPILFVLTLILTFFLKEPKGPHPKTPKTAPV